MATITKDPSRPLAIEDISFEFEPFLKKHEENLPEGLDAHYLRYIPYIERPYRNFLKLPKALVELPISAVLHQRWMVIVYLYTMSLLLGTPFFLQILITANLTGKLAVGITLSLFIVYGMAAAFVYLKIIYGTLKNLIDSRKAPWLVEKIRKTFVDTYQNPWSRRHFSISFIIAILIELGFLIVALTKLNLGEIIGWLIISTLSIPGLTLMLFLTSLTFRYIWINTNDIYDKVIQTIIDRVVGYSKGHESILSKKNYEVVGVLSDTPGLSIRSLGDVPIFGLGASIFILNAILLMVLSPILLGTGILEWVNPDPSLGLTLFTLSGILISIIISLISVLGPLIRIFWEMGKFKKKALSELDPFLFGEITGVALRRDRVITNESQVLFMLRNYIYSMKTSPVNPLRLTQIVFLALVYVGRALLQLIGLV